MGVIAEFCGRDIVTRVDCVGLPVQVIDTLRLMPSNRLLDRSWYISEYSHMPPLPMLATYRFTYARSRKSHVQWKRAEAPVHYDARFYPKVG